MRAFDPTSPHQVTPAPVPARNCENAVVPGSALIWSASEDAQRFYPEMGTLYLTRIGEVIAACLRRHLEPV